jgi:rhodanese-related sulfurtransferase
MRLSLLAIVLISVLGVARADSERADFYDNFASAKNAYTDIGKLPIREAPWFGPIQIVNESEEPLRITGHHSLDLNLQIVSLPEEVIPPGSSGTVEVLYQPRSVGLLTPRLELTTNQGRKTALLRAQVTAENDWEVLGLAWPEQHYHIADAEEFLVEAAPIIEAMRQNPHDNQRILIDPRPLEQYQAAYVPGALNLSLNELLNRPHWRERELYFIDEGSLQPDILTMLRRLKDAGYAKLHWIRGGMRGWQAAGGEVVGSIAATGQWAGLYPSELANSLLRNEFTILNAAGDTATEKLQSIMPTYAQLQWGQNLEDLDRETPLLVVATANDSFLNIEPALRDMGFTRVYYLHDGVDRLIKSLQAWNTPHSLRFRLIQAGARNPLGKKLPISLVDRDCIDCLKNSRR